MIAVFIRAISFSSRLSKVHCLTRLVLTRPAVAANVLTLKLELLQHAGSFKTRGAFTNLLTPGERIAVVISGGNTTAVDFARSR